MSKAILLILIAFQFQLLAEIPTDSTGMLGDNFSLEGALEMFKQSSSPEDFEKRINDENSNVNNLDLNEDGYIDYIKVIDNKDGDSHALVLQIDVNDKESQDVAVIEMEKTSNNKVVIQIVGDENLYGKEMIVEPVPETQTKVVVVHEPAPVSSTIYVNVWTWPTVRYIYSPGYHVWISPWRWRVYPRYWRPWRPFPWRVYHHRRVVYHRHYHPVRIHRVHRAHAIYRPHRRTSVVVKTRSTTFRRGKGRKVVKTNTKTTKVGVKTKNGKAFGVKKTTKTTTVRNKNHKVVGKKKTTKTTKVRKGKRGGKVTRTRKTTVKRRHR